jgi:hypothetical protein
MIIKIKTHKKPAFLKLINYMVHNQDRLFDAKGNSFVITKNLRGDQIDEWVRQYKNNERYRKLKRVNSVYLTHEILSWHRADAKDITIEKLEDLTRTYIEERNPNGIYLAVPHFDKDHYHVHICASGIEYRTGKAMRLGKQELNQLKQKVQQYQQQQYPEITQSIVNHGNSKKGKALSDDKEYQYTQRSGRASDKTQLVKILTETYKNASSRQSFFDELKMQGIPHYIRGGKISGVIFRERKFRLHRIGFPEEKLLELDKSQNRQNEILVFKEKAREKATAKEKTTEKENRKNSRTLSRP